jgi:hypothetical protein
MRRVVQGWCGGRTNVFLVIRQVIFDLSQELGAAQESLVLHLCLLLEQTVRHKVQNAAGGAERNTT